MVTYPSLKGKGLSFLTLMWVLWFFIMLVRTTIGPILPFVEDEFHVSHATAAMLASLFAFGAALSTFMSGLAAGRIGYKRTVLLCLGSCAATFLLISHVRTFPQMMCLIFLFGAVWGSYFPCVIPIITSHFAPGVWGRALAIQDTGASLSVLCAPLLVTLMVNFLSWRQFFYVYAAIYFISGMFFFLFAKEVRVERRQKGPIGGLVRNRSLWLLGIIWVFATGAFMGLYQIIPLYFTKELLFDAQYANTIFGLSKIGGVVFGVTMGFIADRFDPKKSMFIVLCIVGFFTIFIGYPNTTIVQIALFLQGTVIMGFFTVGLIMMSRIFAMEERSMASGIIATMGAIFGAGMTPYLFGLAGDHLSFRVGIFGFGILVLLSSSLIYFVKVPERPSITPAVSETGPSREADRG
jgi:MFS transporter, NNP family, nitrate/nitrite transporter